MFTIVRKQLSRISPRVYAIFAELLLIIAGAALVILDLTYIPDPLCTVRFGDFYTYLVLGGLVAVWSVFGLCATLKGSHKGVKLYLYLLTALAGIQICVGIVHIILLFTLYRKHLVSTCMGHATDKYFWFSLGYMDEEEKGGLVEDCVLRWSTFAVRRTLTWAVFSIILVLATVLIHRYHASLSFAHRQEIESTGWQDEEKPIVTVKRSSESSEPERSSYSSPPPEYGEIDNVDNATYQQRDRLYSEIVRRRTLHSQYQLAGPNSSADTSVHPLEQNGDQDEEYVPPSPPPARLSTSSDLMAPDMPSSSEKLDYDLYRSQQRLSVQRLSVHQDKDETMGVMSRRRNKPQWFQEEHETLLEDDDSDDDNNDDDASSHSSVESVDDPHAR